MKTVSNSIKNALKQPTTQRKGRILVNGTYYEVFNVEYNADCYDDGKVIGNAIASQLDFEMPYIDKFDTFKYYDGIWTGNGYEYVDLGTFHVFDEKNEDDFNKHITAFDNLILFNTPFEQRGTYPKTLYNELQNICQQAGVTLGVLSIPNGSFVVENNQFVSGESNKTVLKQICAISGTYGIIKNDMLYLQLKNTTNETLTKNQHDPVDWKRRSYGINQVIIGNSQIEGEYVIKQDDADIAVNGVHKLEILDNLFAYTQEKRQQLLNALYNQVHGFGYIPYETKGEWLNYLEIGDTITLDDTETIVLRINGKSPKAIESTMSAPAIIDSSIEYVNNTDSVENQLKRTEITVDKQNQTITSVVSQTIDRGNPDSTVNQVSTLTQRVDSLESEIQNVTGMVTTKDSTLATVTFTDETTAGSEPVTIKINPNSSNISYLYPTSELFPSDTTFLKTRTIRFTNRSEYKQTQDTKYMDYRDYYSYDGSTYTLLVKGTDYQVGDTISGTIYQNKEIDYELPNDLLYYDSENYDEFYLDYNSQTCQITQRCDYNADGTVKKLTNPTTIDYEYPSITLTEGAYTVSVLGYSSAYISITLMAKNIYTDQFYTKRETDSRISQTAEEIELGVTETLSNYSTTAEMNSAINIKANEITSSVSETYATKETTDSLSSRITQNANSISSEVTRATNSENALSTRIKQTAKGISLTVNNGSTSSGITIGITKEDGTTTQTSGTIQMTGLVKFTDLSTSNPTTTIINGNNITTGTIKSSNYVSGTSGTSINLSNGVIDTKNFKVSSTGTITATGGTIGGWDIKNDYLGTLSSISSSLFLSKNGKPAYINMLGESKNCAIYSKGNFAVTTDGDLYASNARINGIINATGGKIAGWTINSASISNTNSSGNEVILANGSNSNQDVLVVHNGNNYPFYLRANGYLYATSGYIGGSIIGGGINAGNITAGTLNIHNDDAGSYLRMGFRTSHPEVSGLNINGGGGLTCTRGGTFSGAVYANGGFAVNNNAVGQTTVIYSTTSEFKIGVKSGSTYLQWVKQDITVTGGLITGFGTPETVRIYIN